MNAAIPLLLLVLLASGGGGGEQEEIETSSNNKKKKRVPPPVAKGPGGTVIDGDTIIERSDFFNDVISDAKYYREKLESVDGTLMATAAMFGISVEAIVAYQSFRRMTHILFPDEGESRLDILAEAVSTGMLDQILGKGKAVTK